MVAHSRPTSALLQLLHGDDLKWGLVEQLLARIGDTADFIAWLNSDTKKNPRPKPLPRPGVEDEAEHTFGSAESAVPEAEFWAIWNSGADMDGGLDDAGSLSGVGGSGGV
jgi:hypothetical protein